MGRPKKTTAQRRNSRGKKPPSALDFERNSWTPKIAAAWAGMPERTLYRLLREGVVPCLPMGESQVQKWPDAGDGKRRRSCFRFLIPAKAFRTWWENMGKPSEGEAA